MHDKEVVGVLQQAHDEIQMLRRQLAAAEIDARAYHVIAAVVEAAHRPERGASVDVAWTIRSAIEQIITPNAAASATAATTAE